MDLETKKAVEAAVGGQYEMPDGRSFWIDHSVAQEIARRVIEAINSKRVGIIPVPPDGGVAYNAQDTTAGCPVLLDPLRTRVQG